MQEQKERILVVEDNKTLAKLIAKKLEHSLEMQVDVAYTLAETKLFFARYDYFLTILDVNLPDAPNGEVIDYALSKKKHVIVLSANIDKDFRAKMLKKNIIDYVNKSGKGDIDYIINAIERLRKNRKHKVLVVDDSLVFRKQMESMLKNLFFEVISVAHGEEAMGMLQAKPDISMVLTDYNMPVMNGLDLTIQIRQTYTKNELSILALSSNEDDEITALFLKHGANDYIKKPFSKEEFSVRVNNSIEALENIQEILNYANRDYLTGLYNRRYFFNTIPEYLENAKDSGEKYAIAMIDIDHFKKVNDTYGHDVGDKVIVVLADLLRSSTNVHDIVARFGGEEFCVVLKNINRYSAQEIFERIRIEVQNHTVEIDKETYVNFTISIGALIYNEEETLEENINEADMLLYNAKKEGRNRLVFQA
ncbi:GGDEF domain-containing response regulator [Sulfurimonas paralvinellae]|uniref:diguanylate cyclase n=1 Tax=Sulfurimonas paralvinellae TaxID=317658 RepID=A0A7M1B603_9BACT|nr:diguanylate cyclase [Sulfurimonas paralvinellae]QOP45090.1 diguanylate cyclase [Sulfurimonas paralvinellae]